MARWNSTKRRISSRIRQVVRRSYGLIALSHFTSKNNRMTDFTDDGIPLMTRRVSEGRATNTSIEEMLRAPGLSAAQRQRIIERLCEAERDLCLEKDKCARLISRYRTLVARISRERKRVESLEAAVREYQSTNLSLGRQLDEHSRTLECLAKQTRALRALQSREQSAVENSLAGESGDEVSSPAMPPNELEWICRQLRSAINVASSALAIHDPELDTTNDIFQRTAALEPDDRRRASPEGDD